MSDRLVPIPPAGDIREGLRAAIARQSEVELQLPSCLNFIAAVILDLSRRDSHTVSPEDMADVIYDATWQIYKSNPFIATTVLDAADDIFANLIRDDAEACELAKTHYHKRMHEH